MGAQMDPDIGSGCYWTLPREGRAIDDFGNPMLWSGWMGAG